MVTSLSLPTHSSRFSVQLTLTAVLSLGLIVGFTQSKRDRCPQTVEMHWNNDRDKVLQPGDLPEADHQNDTWVHGSVCHHSISDTFLFLLNNPQMKTSTNHSCSCRCRNLSFDFFTVFVSNGLQLKHRKLHSGTFSFILQEKSILNWLKERKHRMWMLWAPYLNHHSNWAVLGFSTLCELKIGQRKRGISL